MEPAAADANRPGRAALGTVPEEGRLPLIVLPETLSPARRPVEEPSRAYLAVDGGATKTEAALCFPDGECVFARTGPSNPEAYGSPEATANLLDAVETVLGSGAAHDSGLPLGGIFAGVAGVDTEGETATLEGAIKRVAGDVPVLVMNDVVAAWATALRCEPGVVVISGTGSNCFGVGVDGSTWRAGGWGHLLDDTGSGYLIGLDGLRAVVRERDGRGVATSLRPLALSHFGAACVVDLAKAVYHRPLSKADIAGFAPSVERAALEGDPVARSICESAAEDLAATVRAVLRRVRLDGPGYELGLVGGFVESGSLLARLLIEALPGARPVERHAPALSGSFLLACRLGGQWPQDPAAATDALSARYLAWRATT